MNNSLINSSVSMHALQQKLDMVANNMANANTTGYKRKDASFQDVLTSVKQQPQGFQKEGRLSPLGYNQGWGAKLVQAQLNLAQGSLQASDSPLDIGIEGNGLFEIDSARKDANNNPIKDYTRNGSFQLSKDPTNNQMYLTTKDGNYVTGTNNDRIEIPANHHIKIEADGTIFASDDGDKSAAPQVVGQIKIVRVLRPQLLQQLGDNLYSLPAGVANPNDILQDITAPEATANNTTDPIAVRQGFLEASNVALADEMTELLQIQKAFQLNSRAVTSSDTMMGLANNLRS